MDYVKKYGELIKDKAGVKPERARSMIRLGLRAENARTKLLPNKEMPKAFRMLTHLAMESVLKALDHPEKSCWTNIFAPVEIMQCFGLQCVSMECLSSFMSGFKIEDYLIDYAQNEWCGFRCLAKGGYVSDHFYDLRRQYQHISAYGAETSGGKLCAGYSEYLLAGSGTLCGGTASGADRIAGDKNRAEAGYE